MKFKKVVNKNENVSPIAVISEKAVLNSNPSTRANASNDYSLIPFDKDIALLN